MLLVGLGKESQLAVLVFFFRRAVFPSLRSKLAGILRRVLKEVENVIRDFKRMLYESMEDPLIDLTNLENIVRLLLELEPESDAVRRYFGIQVGGGVDSYVDEDIDGIHEEWSSYAATFIFK